MANNQPSEQEIQFRKRARRRLIGAIALVLLMVTVLPMVLDNRETQAPQSEIAISIPSQDGGDFASRIVPVPVEPAPQVAAPVPAPESTVAEPPAAPPADTEAAPVPPVNPAETPTPPPAATDAAASFVVQVGVYADAGNVKKLQEKLSAQGLKSYTENLATANGNRIRLRMGPYASRAEAEQGVQALKAAGIPGMVVAK